MTEKAVYTQNGINQNGKRYHKKIRNYAPIKSFFLGYPGHLRTLKTFWKVKRLYNNQISGGKVIQDLLP